MSDSHIIIESIKSCLTDKPLQCVEDDQLRTSDYAKALTQFIKNADTPVTIGIQGGWGSGKTSLISVLQEQLNNDSEHNSLCVPVNAWEHSLFHSNDSKAEVALSLLNGLAKGVKKSVLHAPWLDAPAKTSIDCQSEKVETAIHGLKLGLLFAGKVAAQMLSNAAGLGDISNVVNPSQQAKQKEEEEKEVVPPLAENVHNLRVGLAELIEKITYQNNPIKVVFFIDDLDRVPPATAVEILDITKNIFDIPNCVFVLAIDYDVVVKGLESKFGKKDINNEREFRQYFDKIIQIPFTMPIGAYGDNISSLLRPALAKLGNKVKDTDNAILNALAEDARLATGGIPRSIKRIINTLSLLQYIANAKSKGANSDEKSELPKDLESRFIIVALHINFPEICRKLMVNPNFPKWNSSTLNLAWKLNVEKNKNELESLGKSSLFDDEWEKVVYCLCATSEWLKSQAFNISKLLNRLLVVLNNNESQDPKELTKNGLLTLENILEGIKVVSIDPDMANSPDFDDSSVKTDRVTLFFSKLQNILAKHLPNEVMPYHTKEYAKRGEDRPYDIQMNASITDACFQWFQDDQYIDIAFYAPLHMSSHNKAEPTLKKLAGKYNYGMYGKSFYYYFSKNFSAEDFLSNEKLKEVATEAIRLYQTIVPVEQALEKLR